MFFFKRNHSAAPCTADCSAERPSWAASGANPHASDLQPCHEKRLAPRIMTQSVASTLFQSSAILFLSTLHAWNGHTCLCPFCTRTVSLLLRRKSESRSLVRTLPGRHQNFTHYSLSHFSQKVMLVPEVKWNNFKVLVMSDWSPSPGTWPKYHFALCSPRDLLRHYNPPRTGLTPFFTGTSNSAQSLAQPNRHRFLATPDDIGTP
jgi:hypothetical protein